MSSIAEILKESRTSMDKAVESSRREFNSIRGGKASSSLPVASVAGAASARCAGSAWRAMCPLTWAPAAISSVW